MPFPENTPSIDELIKLPAGEIAQLPVELLADLQREIDAAAKQMKAVTARFSTALEVRYAMREAGTELKTAWRLQITGAGLGTRLANSIRSQNFPRSGDRPGLGWRAGADRDELGGGALKSGQSVEENVQCCRRYGAYGDVAKRRRKLLPGNLGRPRATALSAGCVPRP